MIKFNNTYVQLPSDFYQLLNRPNQFQASLLAFNQTLAIELNIDPSKFDQVELAGIFAGSFFPPGSSPLAMAYAGHQFGHFVPQLGDGRAMLLGEVIGKDGTRYDLHLKGSGPTQFSRRGDGKSALGPVIREFLVSEGMHFLGIPTTRSLCAVRSGETVMREDETPGGVLTRVAQSHIRVGTFEYFARKGDNKNLKLLADYTIERLYPGLSYLEFWKAVANKQAELITSWMSVGFIHGVMNTDNMSIAGETIDFGPCAFMDNFQYHKVFSSIDQYGRYAYSNQPEILLWNLARLAECLLPLMDNPQIVRDRFTEELERMQKTTVSLLMEKMCRKFGLKSYQIADESLVASWFELMEKNNLDFTLSYIDLERVLSGKSSFQGVEDNSEFETFLNRLKERFNQEGTSIEAVIECMQSSNPMTIPRNHLIQKVIEASNAGDDEKFMHLWMALKEPYKRFEKLSQFQEAPKVSERVLKTFCGT